MTDDINELARLNEEIKAVLADRVREHDLVYVGPGAEKEFGVSRRQFSLIVALLEQDRLGSVHRLQLERPGTEIGERIIVKVLAGPGVTYQEVWSRRDRALKLWVDAHIAR